MAAIVISSVSTKGGTGKTSACKFLGITKVREGKKVLIIDICQNSDIASRLGFNREDFTLTSYEYLTEQVPFDAVVRHDEETGIDFLPSSEKIEKYVDYVEQTVPLKHEEAFARKIKEIADRYDYIFIDNHPTAGNKMMFFSLYASDIAIIPTTMDMSSALATARTIQLIDKFQVLNKDIKTMVIPMAVDFTKGFKKYVDELKNDFLSLGVDYFSTPVRHSTIITKAGLDNIVLPLENPYMIKVLNDYKEISKELELLTPALQEG